MQEIATLSEHLGSFLRPGLTLLVGVIVLMVIRRVLITMFDQLEHLHMFRRRTARILQRIVLSLLWVILALLVIRAAGYNVDFLWTFLTSLMAVVGVSLLATWFMPSNIAASLLISVWKPYEIGQEIEVMPDNVKGKVADINMMYTEIVQDNGDSVLIPNNFFFQKYIRRVPLKTEPSPQNAHSRRFFIPGAKRQSPGG